MIEITSALLRGMVKLTFAAVVIMVLLDAPVMMVFAKFVLVTVDPLLDGTILNVIVECRCKIMMNFMILVAGF